MVLSSILVFLFIVYAALLLYYAYAWASMPLWKGKLPAENLPKVSILIPVRNEEGNIGELLRCIEKQSYPSQLIEVIVINDQSTDNTVSIVQSFPLVTLLHLPAIKINSYKKAAIEMGVSNASGSIIITTDGDSLPSALWVATIVSRMETSQAKFVAAPVFMPSNGTVLGIFQCLDFMVLQGITGASVYKKIAALCNGANLAYTKEAYIAVDGFTNITHIASGDDLLLMGKIARAFPENIAYLKSKDAIVNTQPMGTWKRFFNQRIRWASKTFVYEDKRLIAVLLLVYLFNVSFLLLGVLSIFNVYYLWILLKMLLAKTFIELPLVLSLAVFFDVRRFIPFYILLQPIHILYTCVSGLFSQITQYEWKGRKVK